jgi:hypothetical protein
LLILRLVGRDSQCREQPGENPTPTKFLVLMDGLGFRGVSQKSTSLWAHELAPGWAIRQPPPTMLATDAEWWGHCRAVP